ncbi:hypothetical protein CsatB_002834 [Cannabis sativa]
MKWAWKILEDNSSLWSRLVEAKYLKNRCVLDVAPKNSDSILWKSILNVRSHLSKGICRKIGDGKATSFWFHPWVPNGTLQPQPRADAAGNVSLVSNFISANRWDENMVRRWFNCDDAKRILNITLPLEPTKDSWIWSPEANGKFSIKSAYRVVKNMWVMSVDDSKWRIIWGAKIHIRLKMFWWKILANYLLTRSKLSSLFKVDDSNCPLCDIKVEDTIHLFWSCQFARAVWFGSLWHLRTENYSPTNWNSWLLLFKEEHNRPLGLSFSMFLEGAAIIFERIWKERNNIIHGAHPSPISAVIRPIDKRLQEALAHHETYSIPQPQWLSPPPGWVKCSTDVAIDNNSSAGAAIFWNEEDEIIGLFTIKLNYCDSLAGEIAALAYGAEVAATLHFSKVIFHSDSVNAITAIRIANNKIQDLHHNVQDVVRMFKRSSAALSLWEALWIPRRLNGVAHCVARWAINSQQFGCINLTDFDGSLLTG